MSHFKHDALGQERQRALRQSRQAGEEEEQVRHICRQGTQGRYRRAVGKLTLSWTAMTKIHSKERVMAARVSRRNPTHRLHAKKAYHQELLRSRAATNSRLK